MTSDGDHEIIGDSLELRAAYKAWRDAWQSCAESAVKADMKQWIAQDEEQACALLWDNNSPTDVPVDQEERGT